MNVRSILLVHAVLLGLMLALSGWGALVLPDDVRAPVHWNWRLEPDRWAGKAEILLAAPAMSAFLGLVFAVGPHLDPRRHNLEKSAAAYRVCWLAVASLCAMLHVGLVGSAADWPVRMESVLPMAMGFLLVAVGNVMGKVRSNHIMGVRTRWTLASDAVWTKTNRATGRWFVITGISGFVAAMAGAQTLALGLLMVGSLGSALFGVVHSYLEWRRLDHSETP